jgi:hypothetical protein
MAESSRPKSGKSSRPNSSRPSSAGGPRGLVTFVDDEEYVDLMQESGDLNELSAADGRSASPSPERDSSSGAYDAMAGTQPSSGGGGGGLSALIAERKSERRKEMISVKEEASSRSLGYVSALTTTVDGVRAAFFVVAGAPWYCARSALMGHTRRPHAGMWIAVRA